jgi:hypothetical protein
VGRIGLVVHFLETKDLHMIWPLLGVRGLGGLASLCLRLARSIVCQKLRSCNCNQY